MPQIPDNIVQRLQSNHSASHHNTLPARLLPITIIAITTAAITDTSHQANTMFNPTITITVTVAVTVTVVGLRERCCIIFGLHKLSYG